MRRNQAFDFSRRTGTTGQDETQIRNEYAAISAMKNWATTKDRDQTASRTAEGAA
jgi:hypothetical protein